MKVLITGASGFIGRHVIATLRSSADVFLHARTEASTEHLRAEGWQVVFGDLTDVHLSETFPTGLECVVHLAGLAGGAPEALIRANTMATAELLRAMEARRISHMLFLSTAAVYAESDEKITEEGAVSPSTAYGDSKYAAELLVRRQVDAGALTSAIVFRCNNVYGPGSDHGMVASLQDRIRQNLPVRIDGDGSQIREPLYVGDVASAISGALKKHLSGFHIFNLSGAEAISLKDLAGRIGQAGQRSVQYELSGNPAVPPHALRLDTSKARRELSWEPTITLSQGLKELWNS